MCHRNVISETERVLPLLHELNVPYHKQLLKPGQPRLEPVPTVGHGRFLFIPEHWQEAEEVRVEGGGRLGRFGDESLWFPS